MWWWTRLLDWFPPPPVCPLAGSQPRSGLPDFIRVTIAELVKFALDSEEPQKKTRIDTTGISRLLAGTRVQTLQSPVGG